MFNCVNISSCYAQFQREEQSCRTKDVPKTDECLMKIVRRFMPLEISSSHTLRWIVLKV